MARIRGRHENIYQRTSEGKQPQQPKDKEEHHIGAPKARPLQPTFPRGSFDTSLRVRYQDHVACHFWFSEVS